MLSKEDVLNESLALNHVVIDLLVDRRKENLRLWIALVISILINLLIVVGFLYYNSLFEYDAITTTTTETTTVTQDQDSGGNNIYQAGEYATLDQGGSSDS